jgi:UDP-N-acetylglucosamine 2-epimerase
MKLLTVVGARPQFIKAACLSVALQGRHEEVLVHTGQHYDYAMSDVFFDDLELPKPDHHLGIGSDSHGAQTGAMLAAIESVLTKERPDGVVVYGDTNSTLAGALAAAKLQVPVAHVEAGLRSFNRAMPEEINRVVADHLSSWRFAPSEVARRQLEAEGIREGVHVVGDIMLDALRAHAPAARGRAGFLERLGVLAEGYYLATIHRVENTDTPRRLADIVRGLGNLDRPVLVPLHPRTRKRLAEYAIAIPAGVTILDPQGYLEMLALLMFATCVLTDSGGVQKEAYYLRVPCVTLRDETEWVETVATGWNILAGADPERIVDAVRRRCPDDTPHPDLYGDGSTAARIVEILS